MMIMMLKQYSKNKQAVSRIGLAGLLLLIGCVLPLLIIHFHSGYARWQIVILELVGLGGLIWLFGKLILKK